MVVKTKATTYLTKLSKILKEFPDLLQAKKCIALPDFFIDIIFQLDIPFSELFEKFRANIRGEARNIYTEGGKVIPGGNAFRTAISLATLSCPTWFIGETDELGSTLINNVSAKNENLYLKIKTSKRLNITVAIEIPDDQNGIQNIMLSTTDSIKNWGPENLESNDKGIISEADLVYISNWGINSRGNELLAECSNLTSGKVMFDPGNIFVPEIKIQRLLEILPRIEIISLNTAEYQYLEQISNKISSDPLSKLLAESKIFIHDHKIVKVLYKEKLIQVPTFEIKPQIQTGLGDVFAAGVVISILSELSLEETAILGSAAAGFYGLSNKIPNLDDLESFLQNEKLRRLL